MVKVCQPQCFYKDVICTVKVATTKPFGTLRSQAPVLILTWEVLSDTFWTWGEFQPLQPNPHPQPHKFKVEREQERTELDPEKEWFLGLVHLGMSWMLLLVSVMLVLWKMGCNEGIGVMVSIHTGVTLPTCPCPIWKTKQAPEKSEPWPLPFPSAGCREATIVHEKKHLFQETVNFVVGRSH